MSNPSVVACRDRRIGRIRLNRPKALNALDLPMIDACAAILAQWHDDPTVQAVVIEGEGDRAFCAGGDVRAVRAQALAGDFDAIEAFFSAEYALNRQIAEYPVPYVALVDGLCLGGGIGMSVHGRACVATERASFAMPETAIALFPDVGTTYVMPRLPGALGLYLVLTGTRLQGADAVHAGLATHFVPGAALSALSEALATDGVAVLAGFAARLPPFTLAPHRAAIDRCFAPGSIVEILARLEAEASDWSRATLAALRAASPSSVLWSFEIMRRGALQTLAACLQTELALTRRVTRHPDFVEGVRAMVVDKDRHPRWSPERVEDVDPDTIAAMFAA